MNTPAGQRAVSTIPSEVPTARALWSCHSNEQTVKTATRSIQLGYFFINWYTHLICHACCFFSRQNRTT